MSSIGNQKSAINNFSSCPNSTSRNARRPIRSCSPVSGIAPCPADRVHRNQLYKATLLEIPLVIGRDRLGQPFALRDACPHRGMPLNCGRFDGENLECGYHGWEFDVHHGQCQPIPSLTADQKLRVDRIYAGSYACEEQDSFVWVFIPDPGPAGAGSAPPAVPPDAAPG